MDQKKKLLVLGYYDRHNLGDEMYKITITNYLSRFNLKFVCIDDIDTIKFKKYDGLVFGGGDVINDYFLQKLNKILPKFKNKVKISLSIGIPFRSLVTKINFEHFDHVFIRNKEDLRLLQYIIGSTKAHYLPDLAFLLDQPVKNTEIAPTKTCGIFLINNLIKYPMIVKHIAKLIGHIANDYDIQFFQFDTSANGDLEISQTIAKMVAKKYNKSANISIITASHNDKSIHKHFKLFDWLSSKIHHNTHDANDANNTNTNDEHPVQELSVEQMLQMMSSLDFAVCLRYHAHIFSMLARVPFMSISSTRKTRSLMNTSHLNSYQYNIILDNNGTPINTDYDEMLAVYQTTQSDLAIITSKIEHIVTKNKFMLDHKQVSNLIDQHNISLERDVELFMDRYANDHDNTARLVSYKILGTADTPYIWGIVEKLNLTAISIFDSIKYLLGLNNDNDENCGIASGQYPLTLNLKDYHGYKDVHRGGWYVAIKDLADRMSRNGIFFDMYLDRTFHWSANYLSHCGIIPYTIPWCGFIHHTANTSESNYNLINLFKKKEFLQSLNTCRGLCTLSPSLTQNVEKLLRKKGYNIPVTTFVHPVVSPYRFFGYNVFKINHHKKLIQVGSWLRNYWTIYSIDTKFTKNILQGVDMNGCLPPNGFKIKSLSDFNPDNTDDIYYQVNPIYPCRDPIIIKQNAEYGSLYPCRDAVNINQLPKWVRHLTEWMTNTNKTNFIYSINNKTLYTNSDLIPELNKMLASVKTINHLSNIQYDQIFEENIIFLHLIDAAAVNTIIECIVRNTPVLVNKIQGTIDLLGEHYPLFYTNDDINNNTIGQLLTNSNIKKTTNYLQRMNKTVYNIDYFVDQLGKYAVDISHI